MLERPGADGIGLFRTEFQFLIAATLPGREPAAALPKVLDAAGDKPVVFRTVDIGGDKALPYLTDDEGRGGESGDGLARAAPQPGALDADEGAGPGADRGVGGQGACGSCSRWSASRGNMRRRAPVRGADRLGQERQRAAAEVGRVRRDARGAEPCRNARPAAAAGRLPVDRHQRPDPVPVRRRPRRPAAGRALRLAEPGHPALPAAGRRPGQGRRMCRSGCAAKWAAGRWRRWR